MSNNSVFMDEQLLEERLIEESSHRLIGVEVSGVAVFSEFESPLHMALNDIKRECNLCQLPLSVREFAGYPALLLGEQIHGYRVSVVQMKELGSLVRESRDSQPLYVFLRSRLPASYCQRFPKG